MNGQAKKSVETEHPAQALNTAGSAPRESERFGEETNNLPCRESNHSPPAVHYVACH
jgi:hypothetical protein